MLGKETAERDQERSRTLPVHQTRERGRYRRQLGRRRSQRNPHMTLVSKSNFDIKSNGTENIEVHLYNNSVSFVTGVNYTKI